MASVTVTVADTAGNSATFDIVFPAVGKGDQTLSGFQYSASSVAFGSTAPTVTEPAGAVTTLEYSATPSTVCTVNATTGALTIVGIGSCEITATAASTATYNEATATFTVTVQAVAALVLNVDAITGDDTINIAEKAAGFDITGDTGTEAGVSMTVEIGSTTLIATSADDSGTAIWSVSVPADASYITGTSVDVTVSAAKTGFTSPSAITRTLAVDLTAPTAPSYTAPSSLKVGEAIAAMSPTGGAGIDEYSATGLPSGLSIDPGTGAISGTPDTADAGTASVTVTVADAAGNSATSDIVFPAVGKGDQTLSELQYSASSVAFGSTAPTVTEPAGAVTTLEYSATPSTVCTVNATTGALTIVGIGSCEITATAASTATYNEATATFTVTVQAVAALVLNVAAITGDDTINIVEKAAGFTISGNTGSEGGVSVTVTVSDTDLTATSASADPATWSVSVPADASYITGTSVDVTVSAAKTGFTSPSAITRTLAVDLTAPTAPSYTAPSSLKVGEAIAAMSPTGGAGIDEYSATGLPSGLSIDPGTGAISGTPDTADAGTASVTVTVADTADNSATVDIAFPAVAKGDHEPVTLTVTPRALTVLEGESATYEVVLDSQPESDVTVDTSSDSMDVTVDPSSLTFTSSNWSTAQTVTLSAADDSEVEDDAVSQVTHTVRGGDYGSETASPVTVTVPGFEEDAAGTVVLKVPTTGESVVSVPEGTSTPELAGTEVMLPSGTYTVAIRMVGDNHEALMDPPRGFRAGDAVVDIEPDPPLAAGQTAVVCLPASGAGQHVHRWDDGADPPVWVELEAPAGGSPPGLTCGVTDHFSIFALGSGPSGMPARVVLTVSPERVAEDATGVVQTVTATLNGGVRATDTAVTVSVSGDTATVGDDFAAIPDFTLTIPAGATSGIGTFTLAPVDDSLHEPDETMTVSGEASGLVVLPATVTITDNDEASMILALAPASVPEGGGTAHVTVTATLDAAAAEPVAVTLTLADGTAVAAADFAPFLPVTLRIPAGSSSAAVTVTVTPVDDAVDEGAGETVTVAGSAAGFAVTPATLTLADDDEAPAAAGWAPSTVVGLATAVVPVGPAPLTARFVDEPSEHDGGTPFTVGLAFSEEVAGLSPASLRDTVLGVTGGQVTGARLLAATDNRRWELTVEPAGHADVSIALAPTVDCAAAGAVCTADGRMLSSRLSTLVRGPAVLSVADARVQESADATLDFAVRLSRTRNAETRVDWATGDGTARAGADYRAASGTLVFAIGETSGTVSVAVLADAHDEGDETLTLRLSNPVGARLGDAEATGTIGNTGVMPRAWLARFGRTVADQVLQAAADRLEAARAPGIEVTLAGQRIGGAADAEAREAEARLAALTGWLRDEAGEDAGAPVRGLRSHEVTGRNVLTGSSFALTGGSAADGFASLWGRGAVSSFDGREGDLTLDGEVVGAMLGADWRVGRGTAGLMLSHARGEGGYRSPEGGGEVSTTLTGLYPYGRYAVNGRVTVWGVGGYGAGTLTLEPEGQSPIEADMDLAMAAAGLRAVLVTAPDGGGVELAVKPDALLLRTTSEAVSGGGAAAEAEVTRLRVGVEGTWRGLNAVGGLLLPSLELGVRHDGGNAETGYGADMAAGLAWSDAERGIEAKLAGRGLLTHEDGGLRERGFSASLAWDPAPGSDRGVRLTLAQTMGASASSGADALLARSTMAGLAANDDGEEPRHRRLEATFGYGFPVFADRFTWTPELGVALSQADRSYRLGWRLGLAGHDRVSLDLGLEATRREPANDDAPEHGVALRLNARW